MYQHLCSRLTALPAVPCQTADASTTVHWLPVQHRTDYKVSVLTYKTLNTSIPGYLSQRINGRVNARTLYARRLRHCSSNRSLAPTSRNVLFDAPRRLELTACVWSEATRCLFSNLGWKHSYFVGLITSTHNRLPPALPTLWRFTNILIIIIIIIIIYYYYFYS